MNIVEHLIDIAKVVLPIGPMIKYVPMWVKCIFAATGVLLIISVSLAWYYRDNANVHVGPRMLRFEPKANARHQKSLQVVNNLDVPVYNLRAFARISGASGKEFFDLELVRDPLKPARAAMPDPRDTVFVFSVIHKETDALLIVIPRLKAKKKLDMVVSCDKTASLRFNLLEWQREDPGVQLGLGGSVGADLVRPSALKKRDFVINGMRVVLMQPD